MRSQTLRNWVLAIVGGVALFWGIEQIPGPAKHIPPRLPQHVLVMPHEQFLVEPGYGTFGRILCYDGIYDLRAGYKAFGGWYIVSCDTSGAHHFSYPRSKEWSYAAGT